jgi:enamine deaminase RidA (YjgF/YER057c/UK114 family)
MAEIKIFSPDVLGKPLGQYSQITRVKASEFVYIAGQLASDRETSSSSPPIWCTRRTSPSS